MPDAADGEAHSAAGGRRDREEAAGPAVEADVVADLGEGELVSETVCE